MLEPEGSDLAQESRALPSDESSRSTIIVGLDLAFADQELENEFIKSHNRSQVFNDVSITSKEVFN